MILTKGGNAALSVGTIVANITFGDRPSGLDVDISAYVLAGDGRVRGDADMVFYNQPVHDSGAITLDVTNSKIVFDPSRIPAAIERIAACVVVDGGKASSLKMISFAVQGGPSFSHDVSDASESAIIVAEYYRRNGEWKMRAVGQGFNGGMAPLARSFGMDIADDPVVEAVAPVVAPVNLSKVELRKHKVGVSLAKHGIATVEAEVLFVIDASGSMGQLYRDGTVQETVERIVPVALRLDDDGKMDTWFYASSCRQVEPLDEVSMIDFIRRTMPSPGASIPASAPSPTPAPSRGFFGRSRAPIGDSSSGSIGYGNNEPVVMNAILANEQAKRTGPLLVIFLTDGGIDSSTSTVIKDILRKCSGQAIFWQFVGVGNANYGVLRDLDTISGRVIDNAGFFAVDDMTTIDDDELYDRILSEFPSWLKEARSKAIL